MSLSDSSRRRAGAVVIALVLVGGGMAACVEPSEPEPAPRPTYDVVGTSVMSSDRSMAVRDLYISDPGDGGYQPGNPAPLALQVWNNTTGPISLVAASAADGVPVVLVGGEGEGDGTAPPTSAVFDVIVPPGAYTPLSESIGRYLQVSCVSTPLPVGSFVEVTFEFSNEAMITASVPVGSSLPGVEPTPVVLSSSGC